MIYHGDAAETPIADASIKLLYGSPPYPEARRDYGYWTGPAWLDMMKRHLTMLVAKIREDGFLAINVKANRGKASRGQNSHRRRWVERLLIWVEDELPVWAVDDEMWIKTNTAPTGLRCAAFDAWEPVFLWAKSNPWKLNLNDIRTPYSQATLDRYSRVYKPRAGPGYYTQAKLTVPHPLGGFPRNVIHGHAARLSKEFYHQARQPEYLPERYITLCTDRGDVVYDPWMGSGTTLVAAQRMGRRVAGSDTVAANVEMVKRRLTLSGG